MAKQTRDVLKTYFEDGDTPDQIEFGHLIDSQVNLEDPGEQIVKGTLSASAVGADAYFLKGLAFEQVTTSQISLTGSNIFGSGGAAPTGITSHSFFGPIYQSSSGAHSASYFLTPVIMGGTATNLEGEGLHIQSDKTIGLSINPISQSISASLIMSKSDHHLAVDPNEIHHYGNQLHITSQGTAGSGGNILFRTSVNPTETPSSSLYISSSGNIGINTTTPEGKLEIKRTDHAGILGTVNFVSSSINASLLISNRSASSHPTDRLHLAIDDNEMTQYGGNFHIGAVGDHESAGNIKFRTATPSITSSLVDSGLGDVTRMVIRGVNGNVGIGDDTPDKKLVVSGSISASGDLFVKGITENATTTYKTVMVNTTSGQLHYTGSYGGGGGGGGSTVYWESDNFGIKLITNNHNVGIGGNPNANYKLTVTGDMAATGDVIAYLSSDERLKDNVKPIENPIEKIKQIGGYTFDWNDNQSIYKGNDVGVIAQEIEKVLPSLVNDRDNGYKGVKYDKIVALLIEAVKDQQNQIDELKKLI